MPLALQRALADSSRISQETKTMDRTSCVLFSGAASGAEAGFGAAAEQHRITEVNYSFEGHKDARTRGLRVLTPAELQQGDVSLAYVSKLMHREYRDTPLFKRVLQSIWHQVNSGREVWVVGRILPDDTVKGGTGWGAEFAKLCNKPLSVFDQQREEWYRWAGDKWDVLNEPSIEHPHFTGTGTRFLEDGGTNAINELFERSFG